MPQGGMTADAVVGRRDVVEHACLGLTAVGAALIVDQFPLQVALDVLDRGIVPALRHAAHAASDAVSCPEAAMVVTGVLAAPVGVSDQALARKPAADRHLKSIDDEPAGHGGVH